MLKCQVLSGNVRTTVMFLKCVEKVLLKRCGTDAATWQREMTMKMLLPTSLDADCITEALRSVGIHFIVTIHTTLRIIDGRTLSEFIHFILL